MQKRWLQRNDKRAQVALSPRFSRVPLPIHTRIHCPPRLELSVYACVCEVCIENENEIKEGEEKRRSEYERDKQTRENKSDKESLCKTETGEKRRRT